MGAWLDGWHCLLASVKCKVFSGGVLNVLDEYVTCVTQHVCVVKIQDGPSQPQKNCFLTKTLPRLIISAVVCGENRIEPVLLVLNTWMVRGNTWKNGAQCPRCINKTSKCTKKYTCAYSWTWCQNVALLQSVSSALHEALWQWSVEKRNRRDEWMSAWNDWDDQKRKFLHLSHTPANRNECLY